MENPEKIEIEGLKTIHKLCKFGAEHNMEGCSFTEIVERMFVELQAAKAQVPEGFVLVPREPTDVMRNVFNESWVVIYKAMIEVAEKEMIEAREQGHD